MKKWLVGLMAAGLCVASAWADGVAKLPVNYSLTDKTVAWQSLDGVTQQGLGSIYADGSAKFDTTGDWMAIQFDAVPGALSFKLKGNSASGGEGTLSFKIEESADGETWSPVDTISEIEANQTLEPSYDLASDSRHVRWTYANKVAMNLALNNVAISSGGPAEFSVTFDKENWFKVALGEASSVTAIPKNGVEPYTFLWESDTPELDGGTTDTLEIPATLAEGDYTVACLVTEDNGEGDAINALIGFTVEAIPVISGDSFELVSSTGDLQDGARYLVTDVTHAFAMSSEAVGSALASVDVTETDGVITASDESIIWTLVEDSDGNFALQNGEQYVGWTSGNAAKMQADPFANKISVDEGVATITAASDASRNLKYNKGTPRFAYYTTAQTDLALFKEAGEAGLSVTLDKANGFTVDLGTADSITATAKNGTEPYEYVWSSDTAELNGTGEVLAIPSTLAAGDYTVQVEVTDAEANKVNKQIGFSVVAPAVKYAVNVAPSIQNGTVSADKEQAEEGELVTLTASPAAGYKLGTFLLDGEAIAGNSFNMPAHDVLVSAEFIEKPVVAGFTKITSLDKLEEGEYVITGAKAEGEEYAMMAAISTGSTKFLERRETAVELEDDVVTDAEESIIWTLAKDGDNWTIYNEAVGFAGYVASGNSAGAEAEASDKSKWTIAESETEGLFLLTNVGNTGRYLLYNASSPRFACYEKTTSGKALAFYKGSSGPAALSVSFQEANPLKVEVGTAASVTAVAKGGEAPYTFAWESETAELNGTGATLAIPETLAVGSYTATVTVTDSKGIEVSKPFGIVVSEPAAKFTVEVADGILNGTVQLSIGGSIVADPVEVTEGTEVTVVATPEPGYKLDKILLDGAELTANPFTVTGNAWVTASFVEITGVTYTRVEKAEDFEEGAEYLIVAFSKDKFTSALKNEASGSRIGVEEVVIAEDNTVTTDSDAIVWTIQAGAKDGEFVLFNADKNVYAAGPKSEGNNAQLLADGTDALAQWTLDFADAPAVAIGSVAYPERQLNRNSTATYAYFATYKGSGTKPFLFKKAGAAKPSISYSGETEVTVGESFAIQFTLKNYDGEFTWVNDGREGGEISAEGLYTWTPSEEGEVTITVKAMNGETEIASKEVALTVKPGEVPPPEVTLTCDPASVTMAEGESVDVTVTLDGVDSFDGYIYIVDHEDMCSEEGENPWTFDLADLGLSASDEPYVLTLIAYDGDGELAQTTLSVTVSGEGPQPGVQPVITGIDVQSDKVVVTFTGDGSAVEGTDDLGADWSDVDATISGGTATVPNAKRFLRIRQ